ncbi:hypothetical protein [Bradyrhizobium commune]|uniref:hypothetical protein n=1 Tax=Bradyrhizobium commune TaxID=83627 RepID=UPI001AEDE4C6|nr:hypothetical protein [Bradyrhizobium commune]
MPAQSGPCSLTRHGDGGRLGSYKYLDMHQAIGAPLKTFENDVAPALAGQPMPTRVTAAV